MSEQSQSQLIAKIEEEAGMVYDEIKYIVSKEDQYPVEEKPLEAILEDLKGSYIACPF